MKIIKIKFLSFLVVATGSLATVALAGPPYSVDDPGTVESKYFRVETTYVSSQSKGGETESLPNISLKYGLNDNTNLSFGTGVISKRVTNKEREFGVADTTIGLKWRFKNETKIDPQWAFGYSLKVPTADKSLGLGSGELDHRLWVSTAKSFKRYKVFANAGYNFLGAPKTKDTIFYGIAATYQLTEQLNIGAQLYGNTAAVKGKPDEMAWGVGLKYNFRPDRSLLLQVGRSERGYSDLNVTAGFGINFK